MGVAELAAVRLFELTSDSAAVLQLDGDRIEVLAVNRTVARFLGVEPEEVTGALAERLYPPAELEDVRAKLRTALETREPLVYEAVRELPHGRHVVVGTMVALDDRRVLAFGRDVSEERAAQMQLAALEELAEIGSWQWNLATDELTWSPTYRRIYGLGPEIPPRLETVLERTHPDDRPRVQERISNARLDGGKGGLEYRVVHPDGAVRRVVARSHAVRDGHGRLVRITGTVQDVTEQRELEERERRLQDAGRRRDQALELNDDVIQGLTRAWLALQLGEPDDAKAAIEATTQRMQAIITDLLEQTVGVRGGLRPGDLARSGPSNDGGTP